MSGAPRQESPELGSSRKRVGKACDRCRLKKSKCDGSLPCQRCLADDQICVFSERKRSKEKIYPKGYVELLESRNQVLAEAFQKVLYCHQHDIDTSSLYPRDGKIILNEVLGRLETFKGLPASFKLGTYVDETLESFEEEHRNGNRLRQREGSECSTTPSSRASLDLSREKSSSGSPTTPPSSILPDFSFDGRYLSQSSKAPFFNPSNGIPLSISPSLLMPEYTYPQTVLPLTFDSTFGVTPDSLMMDTDWL